MNISEGLNSLSLKIRGMIKTLAEPVNECNWWIVRYAEEF